MLVTPFSADMNAHIEKYLTNLGLTVFPGPPYDKTRKPGAGVEINPDELFRRVEASYRQNPTTQAIYFQGATLDPLPIQFVAMVFCQMGAAHSLREICGGLATATGKLVPSGPYQAPTRSTLAYANTHRPWQLYQTVFEDLLKSCQALAATKKRRFRFKHPLRNLDASVIELCVKVFDWARFQRTKGAIKLHLQLDHQGYLPCWAVVTDGDTNDVRVAQELKFAPGTIVVMDRGYLDYALYERWNQDGVYFARHPTLPPGVSGWGNALVNARSSTEWSHHFLRSPASAPRVSQPPLKPYSCVCGLHKGELVFLTNGFHLAASTIAAIYKDRWQIELFFKALKQNLKIKTFVGTNENAVNVQIWTALIAMLLLKFLLLKSTWAWSLSNLAAMLRFNLLTYRDLWAWLNAPFEIPIVLPEQMTLFR